VRGPTDIGGVLGGGGGVETTGGATGGGGIGGAAARGGAFDAEAQPLSSARATATTRRLPAYLLLGRITRRHLRKTSQEIRG
jgi:hypothetical protein